MFLVDEGLPGEGERSSLIRSEFYKERRGLKVVGRKDPSQESGVRNPSGMQPRLVLSPTSTPLSSDRTAVAITLLYFSSVLEEKTKKSVENRGAVKTYLSEKKRLLSRLVFGNS